MLVPEGKRAFLVKRFSYGYRVIICSDSQMVDGFRSSPEYKNKVYRIDDCKLHQVPPQPACKVCQGPVDWERIYYPNSDEGPTQGGMAGRHHCNKDWYKIPDDQVDIDGILYRVEV